MYQQVANIVLRKAAKLRTADFFSYFNRDFVRNEWPVLMYNEQVWGVYLLNRLQSATVYLLWRYSFSVLSFDAQKDPSKVALIQIIFWVVKYKKRQYQTPATATELSGKKRKKLDGDTYVLISNLLNICSLCQR